MIICIKYSIKSYFSYWLLAEWFLEALDIKFPKSIILIFFSPLWIIFMVFLLRFSASYPNIPPIISWKSINKLSVIRHVDYWWFSYCYIVEIFTQWNTQTIPIKSDKLIYVYTQEILHLSQNIQHSHHHRIVSNIAIQSILTFQRQLLFWFANISSTYLLPIKIAYVLASYKWNHTICTLYCLVYSSGCFEITSMSFHD